jgi:guanine nucleotide-binding protein subunit alpha
MGCTSSKEDVEGRRVNDAIDLQLKTDSEKTQKEVKCLLLGAGESGKSTILKQMQLIHGVGYSIEEREAYREIVISNLVQSIKVVLTAMGSLGVPLSDPTLSKDVELIMAQPHQIEEKVLTLDLADAIGRLWADEGVKTTVSRSREYQLNDSAR